MFFDWKSGGLLLGAVFFLAVLLVKPIGVSTQFVILDGVLWDAMNPAVVVESAEAKSGYASANAYLDKSGGKYAKAVANPVNYSFVFVLAMALGGALSAMARGWNPPSERMAPAVWRESRGGVGGRMLAALFGGFVVLFGARLAGGCTSGHMMSGMMQTATSGYLFAAFAFAAAIPTARAVYNRGP